jgi:hypothetical protein
MDELTHDVLTTTSGSQAHDVVIAQQHTMS